jgi:hypothetical protein
MRIPSVIENQLMLLSDEKLTEHRAVVQVEVRLVL